MKILFISEDIESATFFTRIINVLYNSDISTSHTTSLGDSVRHAVDNGPFHLIILDMDMKESNPLEIKDEVIEINGDCPIVFTGNHTVIIDRVDQQSFESNKLNDKMPKPINKDKVLNILKPLIDAISPKLNSLAVLDINPKDFIAMKVKFFYLFDSFGYDLYSEVTQTKYMRVIEANINYSHSYLQKFVKNAIKYFYIHKDDHLKYLDEEANKCITVLGKINGAHKDIFLVLIRSIAILHEFIRSLGISETVIRLADIITDTIIDCVERRKNFHNIISYYPLVYDGVPSKSLLCGLMTLLFSDKLTWQALATKKNLVLASILMDFEVEEDKFCFSMTLDEPILKDFTSEQIKHYANHPIVAAQIATQFNHYPDVDYLIKHHHELPTKKGFPMRPSPSMLTSLCAVLNICQYLATRFDGHELNNQIIENFLGNMNQYYNLANFKEILKVAPQALRLKK